MRVLVRLKVPADARGTVPIRADAHWLACTDQVCVPEQGELSLDLPVGTRHARTARSSTNGAARFRSRSRRSAHFASQAARCASRSRSRRASRSAALFLSDHRRASIDYEAPQSFRRSGDWLVAELPTQGAAADRVRRRARARRRPRAANFTPCPAPCRAAARRSAALGVASRRCGRCSARSLGGILLNLMPCVFPILASRRCTCRARAETRAKRAAEALAYTAGRGRRHLRARRGVCSRSARRARRRAGRSSSRTRARSCCCCCWRSRSPPICSACSSCRCSAARARPAGELRHRRARRLRRDALRRAVPRRGARAALLLPRRARCWCSPGSASASRCRSCWSRFVPALRSMLPKPGRWMKRLQRFLAIPMGATAVAACGCSAGRRASAGCIVGARRARRAGDPADLVRLAQRRDGSATGLGDPAVAAALVVAAGDVAGARAHGARPERVAGAEPWSEAACRALRGAATRCSSISPPTGA